MKRTQCFSNSACGSPSFKKSSPQLALNSSKRKQDGSAMIASSHNQVITPIVVDAQNGTGRTVQKLLSSSSSWGGINKQTAAPTLNEEKPSGILMVPDSPASAYKSGLPASAPSRTPFLLSRDVSVPALSSSPSPNDHPIKTLDSAPTHRVSHMPSDSKLNTIPVIDRITARNNVVALERRPLSMKFRIGVAHVPPPAAGVTASAHTGVAMVCSPPPPVTHVSHVNNPQAGSLIDCGATSGELQTFGSRKTLLTGLQLNGHPSGSLQLKSDAAEARNSASCHSARPVLNRRDEIVNYNARRTLFALPTAGAGDAPPSSSGSVPSRSSSSP